MSRPRSLGVRFLLAGVVSTVLALLAATAFFLTYDVVTTRAAMARTLETYASILAYTAAPALLFEDPESARRQLDSLAAAPAIRSAALYDLHGQQFGAYAARAQDLPPGRLPSTAAGDGDGTHREDGVLHITRALKVDNHRVGTLQLVSALPSVFSLLAGIAPGTGAALSVALLLGMAIARTLANSITRPVRVLTRITHSVARDGRYDARVPVQTADEMGTLAHSFNTMLDQIRARDAMLEAARETLDTRVRERTRELQAEIIERQRAERAVQRLNAELENRVRERTADLEAANREMESFSFSVSHDLRTPLRSINGFSQALLEDYGATLPPPAHDHIRRVRAATQHMAQLIDDLLNLARMTRVTLAREPVNLSALADKVMTRLRGAEPQRDVEFSCAGGLTVSGDPHLLEVALENLLGNAWKFTGRNARARIELGHQLCDGEPCLYVRDNGVGFDLRHAQRLFGAFQRLHTDKDFPGTGVGLATVQRIVRRHGGRIWAEAEPGAGATFFFTLPSEAPP